MKLIKFGAAWCNPCLSVDKNLESVNLDGYQLEKLDVDVETDLASKYNIRGVPTLIVVDGDKELGRKVGTLSTAQIQQWLSTFQ